MSKPRDDDVVPWMQTDVEGRAGYGIIVADHRPARVGTLIDHAGAGRAELQVDLDDLRSQRLEVALDLRAFGGIDLGGSFREVLLIGFDGFAVALELQRAKPQVAENLPASEQRVGFAKL